MSQKHLLKNRVEFIPPSNPLVTNVETNVQKSQTLSDQCGEDVKNFYLEVISSKSEKDKKMSTSNSLCKKINIKHKTKKDLPETKFKVEKVKYNTSSFLQAVQNGNLKLVKKILLNQKDLLYERDEFGWNCLMVAASNGNYGVTKELLLAGATWTNIKDGGNNDAYSLACMNGHVTTAHLLLHHQQVITREKMVSMTRAALHKVKKEKMWCAECKQHYYASPDQHSSSISHQYTKLSSNPLPQHNNFFLNHHNTGFKMLETLGWDGKSGLGPSQSGKKYPPKTVLKRDRKGLGLDKKAVARITHFDPNDVKAIKRVKIDKKIYKRQSEIKEKCEKQFEVDFRRYCNS